ncbi:MAG: GntR family transcriptional regulator [Coriobacteriia bacterium]|nr:GntR family transcriptional regulator [Coriobacteriia bacterium]
MLKGYKVDESNGIPIWIQLKSRISYLIQTGFFSPGDRLPTVRELAIDQKVNYNTISKVYLSLERDGLIESKRGRGTFVSENADAKISSEDITYLCAISDELVRKALTLGMSYDELAKVLKRSFDTISEFL